MRTNIRDLSGLRFGRLTALAPTSQRRGSGVVWKCQCSCGNQVLKAQTALTFFGTRSCGCLQREARRTSCVTHGLSNSSAYRRYYAMLQRCHSPRYPGFKNYGGRGLKVCVRWRKSFTNFLKDMGHPPKGMSLERKDNSLGYSPENCVWATRARQSRNHRRNRWIEFQGQRKTITDWAEAVGIRVETLDYRLRRGWSFSKAVRTPTLPSKWDKLKKA